MRNVICKKCGHSATDLVLKSLNGRHQICEHDLTNKIRVYPDGNMMCAVYLDFINLQESKAGFGKTAREAIRELESA